MGRPARVLSAHVRVVVVPRVVSPRPCFRTVLRLFPIGAGTPLWYDDRPLMLEALHLSPALIVELHEWENEAVVASHLIGMGWFERAWILAQKLAVEIGDEFIVQTDAALFGHHYRQVRSNRPPSNSSAAAAFRETVRLTEEERRAVLSDFYRRPHPAGWHDAVKVFPDATER